MSGEMDEENIMRMTKEELQRWIQAEVERNPQLMQRHEQLAQVEEWVKQREGEATYTRLMHSNAYESVLECESVMKGLYGMLGLHYRDEDSEEEGGVREPRDVIQIIDDEEDGEKKSACDNDNDIVVVDLGATKESLEPMLEKVTVAMERSSRLVQDLVEMVTKTSSGRTESSLDISIRPSSTLTPETSSSGCPTPAQCSSPMNQQPRTDSSFAIIKTESLWMATTPSLLSNSPKQPETIGTHNTEFTSRIKTEPPCETFSLQNNCKDHKTTYPSIASIKTEPELMEVTPDIFFRSSNSMNAIKPEHDFMPVISKISSLSSDFEANRATVKTEPQSTPVSSEISPPETIVKHNSDSISTLKTEPSFTKLKSEQPEMIPSHGPDRIKTKPQLTVMSSETSSLASNSEQPETIPDCNSAPDKTSEMSSPSNSEQDNAISPDKSTSTDKAAAEQRQSSKSPEPSEKPKTRLRSSTASSNTPSSRKETTRPSSHLDESDDAEEPYSPASSDDSYHPPSKSSKNDESDDTEDPDSAAHSDDSYQPPSKSSKNKAKKNTSKVTSPSLRIPKPVAAPAAAPTAAAPPAPAPTAAAPPAPAAKPSDAKQISTASSGIFPELPKEVELQVDTVVLAKVKSKTWYRGKVVETKTEENGHRYNIEFKNDKKCLIPAHHVAFLKPPLLKDLFIGCRVVVSIKDEQDKMHFDAAVLVELPDRRNRMRFLVFYDYGRATYLALPDLHLVCKQIKHVWKDIEDETCRSQVKEYLSVYPNPIAVVLRIGQDTKAKRNGKFESCSVHQLDGSLVQICYKSDNHKEWVYKGSDKLEHIVNIKKRLAQQKQQESTGNNTSASSASSHVPRQSDSTSTTTITKPSPSPQNTNTSPASSTDVTRQTGGTPVSKSPSPSPQNNTPAVSPTPATQQTDNAVAKAPSLSPQNTTAGVSSSHVTQQTDNAVAKAPSLSPQNTTAGVSSSRVTQQTATTITRASSISLEKAKSAAFQPMVVLEKLAMPLFIPPAAIEAVSYPELRTEKRPADDEVEEHVSEKNQAKFTNLFHRCCPACLNGTRPKQVDMYHGENPLQIPLLFNFRRMTARRRLDGNVFFHIFYRSPCGRSLCDMEEVQNYLFETRCDFLFLEMFCMDPFVLVNRARPPSTSTSQPYLYLPDISVGREVLPLPCINEVDQTPAPRVKYTRDRILAPGVSVNTSLDFMTGCDCTDGCRDRTKCSCHRLTIEATSLCSDGPVDVTAGYTYKRLQTSLPTGVYECNPLCRCDPRICSSRLVQHGLQLRLELFMTQHKGWGIRCKDDVAKGTFVCVFTGKIVTEDKVNEDDVVSGNEYLANLDFIEGVEKLKEGYESEAYCSDTETESSKKTRTMKTGPLWKNILFQADSSSGEDKDEPMELGNEREKMDACDTAFRERKLSHKPQKKSEGQKVSGPKRCFAIKSFERRVKALEKADPRNEKTRKGQPGNNTRKLFDGEEMCYIIDARQEGNLGRFINHSCSPNLFVQNVFVDTHDLRFPWVAFFANKRIKAGTEMTWDYNYEVGSVEGKVLLCCCGSSRCTGRLL
ncbi:histone-lysine N-methyltransferase SETDB1-A [Triplophysa rosa]|uniref:histone-lysine N-methyltransferase SETDB1-A n=1 Tax=Triplophysa rosa TaxID=992332 RepID=UPI002545C152|nr:histone-lysine N-methyltransferase SETDB1-A [Triplophysa rosa]